MTVLARHSRRTPGHRGSHRAAPVPAVAYKPAPAPSPAAPDPLDFPDGKTIAEAIADLDPGYETGPPGRPGDLGPDATPAFPVADLTRLHQVVTTGIIPAAPLTLPAAIFDDMGGHWTVARTCWYCRGPQCRGDLSWRYDALTRWSCPPCQMRPDWRAPSLPAPAVPAAVGGAVPAGVNGGAGL
jgi:hypothetical protein